MINGLILAGGKSSRMHTDKKLLHFHGRPQHEHLSCLLKPFCEEVYISCNQNEAALYKNSIADHFDLNSPLNGVLSAFHFDPQSAWLTVPVDMPNVNEKVIEYLLQHRDRTKAATCFTDSEGEEPEPLLTLWEPKSKPMLFDFFNSGGFSAKKFLQEEDINLIPCPNRDWLLNINTEEDLKNYLKK